MKSWLPLAIVAVLATIFGCGNAVARQGQDDAKKPTTQGKQSAQVAKNKKPMNSQEIVVGAGCFWCVENLYDSLKGIYSAEAGYAGGARAGVTYEQISSGTTGHAEVIKVLFDPKVISAEDVLRIFFTAHDPTQKNRQGNDVGTQYRSAIFYTTPEEKTRAEKIIAEMTANRVFSKPIVTTLEPLTNYTRAEEYHQDYFAKFENATPAEQATMNVGYCNFVVSPKIAELRKKYASRMKDQ